MTVERVPWSAWWPRFARAYRVGRDHADHVTILGPTGTGKTVLALRIAELRRFVVVLGTKPRDRNLARATSGWYPAPDGELPSPTLHNRVVVWPPHTDSELDDVRRHRAAFQRTLRDAYTAGGWHVVADEMNYLMDDLRMRGVITRSFRGGRSMAHGMIVCAQRPRHVPLEALSGAQHVIMFGTNDEEDVKRLGGLNGVSSDLVRSTVRSLGRAYDFLHVNTRTGAMSISRMDHPPS